MVLKMYSLENRGWELVATANKDADALVAEMEDTIYFADPSKRNKAV
jgi:hypothetical protein